MTQPTNANLSQRSFISSFLKKSMKMPSRLMLIGVIGIATIGIVSGAISIKQKNDLLEKARNIKLLALDVDGTLTDGHITYYTAAPLATGTTPVYEIKSFDVKDGFGLARISKTLTTVLITGKDSPIVAKRAKELNIHKVFQNVKDKKSVLEELCKTYNIKPSEICFMGDDIPDLPALQMVGLPTAPKDAVKEVKKAAYWIASKNGGAGAVRELTDMLQKAQETH
jgi:3-deoxy-D-manno-octulosonate 8-phosphate phosphatase (KDO 8-P phosphatase)